jgi:transcriptional regulator with XRE-family HTH domain
MASRNSKTRSAEGDRPSEHDALVSNIGSLIRRERQKRDMTMADLCKVARISQAFLSLVERGKSTPSLGTLSGIAKALGLPVSAFLQIGLPPNSVTREGERPDFAVDGSPVRYERMSTVFPGQHIDALIMHVPPGFKSSVVTNVGEEWIYILDGELIQTVDDTRVRLRAGDSCHFRGDSPHTYENGSDAPVRMIWVGTVSLFGESDEAARGRV